MSKKFNLIICAYLASFVLMVISIDFDAQYDKKLSEFFSNYNIIYNADYPDYLLIAGSLSFLVTVISAILMLFRIRYSQYAFVFFSVTGYFLYFFEVDTIYVSSVEEDLYSSLWTFFEGALVALIMFNDDIGFGKDNDESVKIA